MDLTDSVYHCCFLRDTDNQKRPITPFLMSTENHMDLGTVPGHLPELIQVEEIVIAQAHVQMLVKRVCGHQYQYIGHCVIFLQNIVQTVDILPNLLAELDIVLLQPPESLTNDTQYQQQFRTDFWICHRCILTWLHFLKANHPDYCYITISADCIVALPVDDDVSSSVVYITDDILSLDRPEGPIDILLNTQSAVLSLDQDTIEANLILEGITGYRLPITGLLAPSI
jgi:hypothetical protein